MGLMSAKMACRRVVVRRSWQQRPWSCDCVRSVAVAPSEAPRHRPISRRPPNPSLSQPNHHQAQPHSWPPPWCSRTSPWSSLFQPVPQAATARDQDARGTDGNARLNRAVDVRATETVTAQRLVRRVFLSLWRYCSRRRCLPSVCLSGRVGFAGGSLARGFISLFAAGRVESSPARRRGHRSTAPTPRDDRRNRPETSDAHEAA